MEYRRLVAVIVIVALASIAGVQLIFTDGGTQVQGDPSAKYDPTTVLGRVENLRGLNTTSEIRIEEAESNQPSGGEQSVGLSQPTVDALQLPRDGTFNETITARAPYRHDHVRIRLSSESDLKASAQKYGTLRPLNGSEIQELLLAHEFAHAIQSDWQLLGHGTAGTTDGRLAQTAIVEGDATVVEIRYAQTYLAVKPSTIVSSRESVAEMGSWKSQLVGQTYVSGYRYYQRQDMTAEERSRAMISPPTTTAQILHPHKNLTRPRGNLPPAPDVRGYERNGTNRLGELVFRVAFQDAGLSEPRSKRAAAGWRNDSVTIYERPGTRVALFQVRFANASEAAEFSSGWRAMLVAEGGDPSKDIIEVPDDKRQASMHYLIQQDGPIVKVVASSSAEAVRDIGGVVNSTQAGVAPYKAESQSMNGGVT
jgi:hypothetical protein